MRDDLDSEACPNPGLMRPILVVVAAASRVKARDMPYAARSSRKKKRHEMAQLQNMEMRKALSKTAKQKAEKTKRFIDWSSGLYYNDRLLS